MKFKYTLLASSFLIMISSQSYADFRGESTDYSQAQQIAYTFTPGTYALNSVNTILCMVDQVNAQDMLNKGVYTALINFNRCGSDIPWYRDRSQSQQLVIVNSERDSNTTPQQIEAWIPNWSLSEDSLVLIKAFATITQEPTEAEPLQDFTLRWDLYAQDADGIVGEKVGGGFIKAIPSSERDDGQMLVEYFESTPIDDEIFTSAAKILKDPKGRNGLAITMESWDSDNENEREYYGLVWDEDITSNRVKVQNGNNFANNISGLNGDLTCLARDVVSTAVLEYGVYEKATGNEVEVNTGFPFIYNNKHGYIGYWGIWTEDGVVPTENEEVFKIDYVTGNAIKTPVKIETVENRDEENNLQQPYIVSNESGEAITFEAPKKFTLEFDSKSMSRNPSKDDEYDGDTFFLEYSGNGNLWGFPFKDLKVLNFEFPFPAVLKDGVELTKSGDDEPKYVVKAWELVQILDTVDAKDCSELNLVDLPGKIPNNVDTTLLDNRLDIPSYEGLLPAVINGKLQ
ncbi:hypothetical protein [Thiomicrospira cyclica]|uniref:Uncharacterized protein n=1 Tax=Thiomicrospira cyclica (strain DSM 14477 / JCM 11371 / ALM1) TaxID=717773 RepID=F6DD25_THICA|nr:hypothetical protein [Thiomicrospira cyclica]AEG31761.1 hypothetical protein Thicy_0994 [Thiomicrospira cyclica ALM1]